MPARTGARLTTLIRLEPRRSELRCEARPPPPAVASESGPVTVARGLPGHLQALVDGDSPPGVQCRGTGFATLLDTPCEGRHGAEGPGVPLAACKEASETAGRRLHGPVVGRKRGAARQTSSMRDGRLIVRLGSTAFRSSETSQEDGRIREHRRAVLRDQDEREGTGWTGAGVGL